MGTPLAEIKEAGTNLGRKWTAESARNWRRSPPSVAVSRELIRLHSQAVCGSTQALMFPSEAHTDKQ